MSRGIGQRVAALRAALGLSQASFGQTVGVSQPTVSRWEKEEDFPEDVHVTTMASLAGVTPAEFRYGTGEGHQFLTVPIVGYIGAGEAMMPVDDFPKGQGFERVPPPPEVPASDLVAVRIRGDSMRPLKDGWLVYYRRDQDGIPDDCVGELCIAKVQDGPTYIKELRRGSKPGRFHLLSWSAGTDVLENQPLEWAAPVVAITRP